MARPFTGGRLPREPGRRELDGIHDRLAIERHESAPPCLLCIPWNLPRMEDCGSSKHRAYLTRED